MKKITILVLVTMLVFTCFFGCTSTTSVTTEDGVTSQNISEDQSMTTKKALLRIVARRVLSSYPGSSEILKAICVTAKERSENGNLGDIGVDIANRYSDVFAKDPLLAADIKDILSIIGVNAAVPDFGLVTDMSGVLCSLI